MYKALSKVFENEILVDPEHFPIGKIEQLKNWWPDEKHIDVLAGTYTKPELGRKRKQTASAGQTVSSAPAASDESPPRKRTEGGSIQLRRKKQPTTKRKRSRDVDTSEEEEDDGPIAAEDPAGDGFDFDDGTQTKVSAHANCLAASCTMTALNFTPFTLSAANCTFYVCARLLHHRHHKQHLSLAVAFLTRQSLRWHYVAMSSSVSSAISRSLRE